MNILILTLNIVCFVLSVRSITIESESLCSSEGGMDSRILDEISVLRNEVSTATRKIGRLQNDLTEYKNQRKDVFGGFYIRWGHQSCPGNDTDIVYTGYMAGSNRDNPGTGSNYLCLTDKPVWGYYKDNKVESLGKITGAEYQFWNQNSGTADFFGSNIYKHNAPCAFCHTQRRTTLMIPGRNRCYDGWMMEYNGYLVSGHADHKSATEYVCLDRRPATVINGNKDDGDNLLYLVEGVCGGSLACPPYEEGREITCVVCSI